MQLTRGNYILTSVSQGVHSSFEMLPPTHTHILQMVNLYCDPHGEKIFTKCNPTTIVGADAGTKAVPRGASLNVGAFEAGDDFLQSKIKELKEVIQAREKRINELEEILSTFKVSSLLVHYVHRKWKGIGHNFLYIDFPQLKEILPYTVNFPCMF